MLLNQATATPTPTQSGLEFSIIIYCLEQITALNLGRDVMKWRAKKIVFK